MNKPEQNRARSKENEDKLVCEMPELGEKQEKSISEEN